MKKVFAIIIAVIVVLSAQLSYSQILPSLPTANRKVAYLYANQGGYWGTTLMVGYGAGATDSLDTKWGESALPPYPPVPSCDLRWTGATLDNGSWVDIRAYPQPAKTGTTFNLRRQSYDASYWTVTVYIPEGTGYSLVIKDAFGGLFFSEEFTDGYKTFLWGNNAIENFHVTFRPRSVQNDLTKTMTQYIAPTRFPVNFQNIYRSVADTITAGANDSIQHFSGMSNTGKKMLAFKDLTSNNDTFYVYIVTRDFLGKALDSSACWLKNLADSTVSTTGLVIVPSGTTVMREIVHPTNPTYVSIWRKTAYTSGNKTSTTAYINP